MNHSPAAARPMLRVRTIRSPRSAAPLRAFRSACAAAALVALAACSAAPQQPFAEQPIPEGFTFRATQPVAISITESAALGLAGTSAFELRTPDDGVVFSGGISTAQPVALNLAIATRHDHLVAVLAPGATTERRFTVPIQSVGGVAQGSLELR